MRKDRPASLLFLRSLLLFPLLVELKRPALLTLNTSWFHVVQHQIRCWSNVLKTNQISQMERYLRSLNQLHKVKFPLKIQT